MVSPSPTQSPSPTSALSPSAASFVPVHTNGMIPTKDRPWFLGTSKDLDFNDRESIWEKIRQKAASFKVRELCETIQAYRGRKGSLGIFLGGSGGQACHDPQLPTKDIDLIIFLSMKNPDPLKDWILNYFNINFGAFHNATVERIQDKEKGTDFTLVKIGDLEFKFVHKLNIRCVSFADAGLVYLNFPKFTAHKSFSFAPYSEEELLNKIKTHCQHRIFEVAHADILNLSHRTALSMTLGYHLIDPQKIKNLVKSEIEETLKVTSPRHNALLASLKKFMVNHYLGDTNGLNRAPQAIERCFYFLLNFLELCSEIKDEGVLVKLNETIIEALRSLLTLGFNSPYELGWCQVLTTHHENIREQLALFRGCSLLHCFSNKLPFKAYRHSDLPDEAPERLLLKMGKMPHSPSLSTRSFGEDIRAFLVTAKEALKNETLKDKLCSTFELEADTPEKLFKTLYRRTFEILLVQVQELYKESPERGMKRIVEISSLCQDLSEMYPELSLEASIKITRVGRSLRGEKTQDIYDLLDDESTPKDALYKWILSKEKTKKSIPLSTQLLILKAAERCLPQDPPERLLLIIDKHCTHPSVQRLYRTLLVNVFLDMSKTPLQGQLAQVIIKKYPKLLKEELGQEAFMRQCLNLVSVHQCPQAVKEIDESSLVSVTETPDEFEACFSIISENQKPVLTKKAVEQGIHSPRLTETMCQMASSAPMNAEIRESLQHYCSSFNPEDSLPLLSSLLSDLESHPYVTEQLSLHYNSLSSHASWRSFANEYLVNIKRIPVTQDYFPMFQKLMEEEREHLPLLLEHLRDSFPEGEVTLPPHFTASFIFALCSQKDLDFKISFCSILERLINLQLPEDYNRNTVFRELARDFLVVDCGEMLRVPENVARVLRLMYLKSPDEDPYLEIANIDAQATLDPKDNFRRLKKIQEKIIENPDIPEPLICYSVALLLITAHKALAGQPDKNRLFAEAKTLVDTVADRYPQFKDYKVYKATYPLFLNLEAPPAQSHCFCFSDPIEATLKKASEAFEAKQEFHTDDIMELIKALESGGLTTCIESEDLLIKSIALYCLEHISHYLYERFPHEDRTWEDRVAPMVEELVGHIEAHKNLPDICEDLFSFVHGLIPPFFSQERKEHLLNKLMDIAFQEPDNNLNPALRMLALKLNKAEENFDWETWHNQVSSLFKRALTVPTNVYDVKIVSESPCMKNLNGIFEVLGCLIECETHKDRDFERNSLKQACDAYLKCPQPGLFQFSFSLTDTWTTHKFDETVDTDLTRQLLQLQQMAIATILDNMEFIERMPLRPDDATHHHFNQIFNLLKKHIKRKENKKKILYCVEAIIDIKGMIQLDMLSSMTILFLTLMKNQASKDIGKPLGNALNLFIKKFGGYLDRLVLRNLQKTYMDWTGKSTKNKK